MTQKQKRAAEIVAILKATYPEADCTLDYQTDWQLLVAAILSAQCTDARVNKITPALFARFPKPSDVQEADYDEIAALIKSCGLFRSKTQAIIGSARLISASYAGKVPDRLDALLQLPGVGRKIANLILGDYYQIPAIVVDTHCSRISQRLNLTRKKDPAGIEKDLEKTVQKQDWIAYGHLMVLHGRNLCMARQPDCPNCPVLTLCPTGKKKIGPDGLALET